ncbi:hypothetical protein RJ640_022093 [Escallonia rubra]|uniref:Reverse transcriptase Ty1/copia-type domain-containing protein n=1 Tax=Escallonia rubra TaxID=112253 RepID=A0AA88R4V1_9ASTE|nr:hypothetical protein RJ640_022093 [Escallonia rubra]
MANSVILFNAPSHLPTKLTYHNFTVWRTQLFSGLIGHNLLGFIDGSTPPPPQTIPESSTSTKRIPNPEYILWHRQDQLILNAMLGSCIDTIQPHISTVSSSQEAWERLLVLFANKSRSRVMSLKERLLNNPRGTRSIQEYLQHMRAIADDLALVDNPLSEDDLVLYTLAGVGPEFKEIAAAIRARDTPISFDELYDKLGDYELHLKKEDSTPLSIATANYTYRPNRFSSRTAPNSNNASSRRHSDQFSPRGNDHTHGRSNTNSANRNHLSNTHNRMASPRSSLHCRFCDRPGHATNECRKLARFLRENDVQSMYPVHSPQTTTPTANATTFNRSISPSWLFDTGASNHVTSDTDNLQTYTDYGGPDEIHISDGSDDIILTGNNTDFLNSFVKNLDLRFSLKDLGSLHHFLGVEVIPTSSGLFLSQHRHINDLLQTFSMTGAKEVNTPMSTTFTITVQDGSPPVDPTPYRKLVGALQYLSLTRADISFAVNRLSQVMHSPTALYWTALKHVLRYLKATIHHGSNPISWKSTRQKSVSRSSSEAEYNAVANSTAEILWVTNLLHELGIILPKTPVLFCDNTGATYLCANPVFHSRMKHIALDYPFVRECVTNGSLRVHHITTKDQPTDILTKALPRSHFLHLRSKIGVTNGTSILRWRVKR